MNMVKQHGHVRKQHQQRHQQQEQSQAAGTTATGRQQQQQPPEATAIGSSSSNQQKQPGQQQTTATAAATPAAVAASSHHKQAKGPLRVECRARGRCRHLHRTTMAGKQTRGETEERYNKTGTKTTRRTRHERKKRRHPSHGQPQHSGLISPTRMRIWVAPASLRRSRWGPWSRWSQWGRWSRWSRWGRWNRADEADGQAYGQADGQADGPGAPHCKAPMLWKWCLAPEINLSSIASIKRVAGYRYMYRDTLTHSTLPTCTRNGAAKSTPTVNGTGAPPKWRFLTFSLSALNFRERANHLPQY